MRTAMDGTIKTDIGISSPDCVSTVAAPSLWCDVDVVPKDATAKSTCDVEEIYSLFAISAEINQQCASSSKRMLAWVLTPLTMTGAIAVLSKQVML